MRCLWARRCHGRGLDLHLIPDNRKASEAGRLQEKGDVRILQLVPKLVAAGIGCRKGTPEEKIEDAVEQCMRDSGIREEALCAVASIDLKKRKMGCLIIAERRILHFLHIRLKS